MNKISKYAVLLNGDAYWGTYDDNIRKYTLNDDMSVSYELVTEDEKAQKDILYEICWTPHSVAKLEWERVTPDIIILRARLAKLNIQKKKSSYSWRHGAYGYVHDVGDNSGVFAIDGGYKPQNDRYMVVKLKEKVIDICTKTKTGKFKLIKSKDLHVFHLYGFNEFFRCELLKRHKCLLFLEDDFFAPILELCKNNKEYEYILDVFKDEDIQKVPENEVMKKHIIGMNFSKSIQDIAMNDNPRAYFPKEKSQTNQAFRCYQYGHGDPDSYGQVTGCLCMLLDSGLEYIYKSFYKMNFEHMFKSERLIIGNNLSEVNGLASPSQKIINETYKFLTNPQYYLAQGKNMGVQSKINSYVVKSLQANQNSVVSFAKAIKGYNNFMTFMTKYFEDYWYYSFLIQYHNHYENHSRYVHSDSSPEEIFESAAMNMVVDFFENIRLFNELLRVYPGYTNNVEGFAKYFVEGCRKQGFSHMQTMIVTMNDYVEMQTSLGVSFEKYPNDLMMVHNIANVNKMLAAESENFDSQAFNEAVNKYRNLEYSTKDFTVIVPERFSDLFIEGATLNHCVANYISKVTNGSTKILFLRKREDLQSPFYTVAIEGDNRVTQIKGINQKDPDTSELNSFIHEWMFEKGLF